MGALASPRLDRQFTRRTDRTHQESNVNIFRPSLTKSICVDRRGDVDVETRQPTRAASKRTGANVCGTPVGREIVASRVRDNDVHTVTVRPIKARYSTGYLICTPEIARAMIKR